MMSPFADQWTVCAYHEIGHCIGYERFGIRFSSVRIFETDEGRILGNVKCPAGNYKAIRPIEKAICCLLGPICEEQLTGIPIPNQPYSRMDVLMACNALAKLKIGPKLSLESLLPFGRLLIEHQQPQIRHLATQLLIYHELSYSDVIRLLR
jgi:hypothetical protein